MVVGAKPEGEELTLDTPYSHTPFKIEGFGFASGEEEEVGGEEEEGSRRGLLLLLLRQGKTLAKKSQRSKPKLLLLLRQSKTLANKLGEWMRGVTAPP